MIRKTLKTRLATVVFGSAIAMMASVPALAAQEDEPTALAMTGDLLIARPAGAVITAVGAVAFVLSLPFSAAGGNVEQAAQTLVVKPAKATFVRCLGCKSTGRYVEPRSE